MASGGSDPDKKDEESQSATKDEKTISREAD